MSEGTFRKYVELRFSEDKLQRIGQANAIIDEYRAAGYSMTLRQLYYQHVARGLIENSLQSYNQIKDLISTGRLAGLVDWEAIEDRTRNLMGHETLKAPEEAVRQARDNYKLDLWADQPCRPEVWVEKEALVDVVGQICSKLRVDFFACRGYVSQSEAWRAGRRMAGRVAKGQRPVVFHLGDHDPSGIDMTRDNQERLSLFAGVEIQVVRLALNMKQIRRYNPPPNPAKVSDARFASYQMEHGDLSWELDALDPPVIRNLIEDAVLRVRDAKLWDEALKREVMDLQWLDDLIADGGKNGEEDD